MIHFHIYPLVKRTSMQFRANFRENNCSRPPIFVETQLLSYSDVKEETSHAPGTDSILTLSTSVARCDRLSICAQRLDHTRDESFNLSAKSLSLSGPCMAHLISRVRLGMEHMPQRHPPRREGITVDLGRPCRHRAND